MAGTPKLLWSAHPPHTAASPRILPSLPQRVKTNSPTPFLRLMVDLLMFFAETYKSVFKVGAAHLVCCCMTRHGTHDAAWHGDEAWNCMAHGMVWHGLACKTCYTPPQHSPNMPEMLTLAV